MLVSCLLLISSPAQSRQAEVFLVAENPPRFISSNARHLTLAVAVANISGTPFVRFDRIRARVSDSEALFFKDGERLPELSVERNLTDISQRFAPSQRSAFKDISGQPIGPVLSPEVVERLARAFSEYSRALNEFGGQMVFVPLAIELPRLRAGDTIPITLRADVLVAGPRQTVSTTVEVRVEALVSKQGWYPGDGHVHTYYSSDNEERFAVDNVVRMGLERGLTWLAITDHAQQFDDPSRQTPAIGRGPGNGNCQGLDEWSKYVAEIQAVGRYHSIPLLTGLEISTRKYQNDSHYLGYNLVSFVRNGHPRSACRETEHRDHAQIVQAVRQNHVHGFGVIAHPEYFPSAICSQRTIKCHPWFSYGGTIEGANGMEIISNTFSVARPGSSLITRWDRILNDRCGRPFAGVSHSDASLGTYHGFGERATYVFAPYGLSLEAIRDAYRSGRVVASIGSPPPLLVFGIYDNRGKLRPIGSVVSVGRKARLRIEQYVAPVGTVRVIQDGLLIDLFGDRELPVEKEYAVTKPGYFRVEAVGRGGSSLVYANPIWVHPEGQVCR